jgi:hypothetical protein
MFEQAETEDAGPSQQQKPLMLSGDTLFPPLALLLFGYIFGQVASHLTNTGSVQVEREENIVSLWRHMTDMKTERETLVQALSCLPTPSSLHTTSLSSDEISALLPATVNNEVRSLLFFVFRSCELCELDSHAHEPSPCRILDAYAHAWRCVALRPMHQRL